MESEQSILDLEPFEYERASTGQRFVNYFIDIIIARIILYAPIVATNGSHLLFNDEDKNSNSNLLSTILGLLLMLAYYVIMEFKFGKTLGKMATRTKVTQLDGSPITIGQAFGRTFSRIIPFEAFSALSNSKLMWHDSIPGTQVVKDR